jgi:hypothetical protein
MCSPKHLGYNIDPTVANLLYALLRVQLSQSLTPAYRHITAYRNLIDHGLTVVLVLHPIACGLALLTLLLSLLMARPTSGTTRFSALMTTLAALISAILTTVIFIIDVVLVAVVNKRVKDETHGAVGLGWGNGVWMVLGAMIALWLALLGATCGIFQLRRARRNAAATY